MALQLALIALFGTLLTCIAMVIAARVGNTDKRTERIEVHTNGFLRDALTRVDHNSDRISDLERRFRTLQELGILAALHEPDENEDG